MENVSPQKNRARSMPKPAWGAAYHERLGDRLGSLRQDAQQALAAFYEENGDRHH